MKIGRGMIGSVVRMLNGLAVLRRRLGDGDKGQRGVENAYVTLVGADERKSECSELLEEDEGEQDRGERFDRSRSEGLVLKSVR